MPKVVTKSKMVKKTKKAIKGKELVIMDGYNGAYFGRKGDKMVCSMCGIGNGEVKKKTTRGDTYQVCNSCNKKLLEADKHEGDRE